MKNVKRTSSKGPAPIYPWAKWLAPGAKHTLIRGKHYTSTVRTMIQYIYSRAKHNNVRVSIHEQGSGKLLVEVVGKVSTAKRKSA